MNYPTAIVIAAALIAGAVFAGNWASASGGAVGVYEISTTRSFAWCLNTVTGELDAFSCLHGECKTMGSISADGEIK